MSVLTDRQVVLELRDVRKVFGPVVALARGGLRLEAGSIHALLGENGAGKSTLVKIVAGVYQRDAGEVLLDGQPVDVHSTAASKAAGIAVIYQEPTALIDGTITGAEGDTFTAEGLSSGVTDFTVGADGVVVLGDPFVFNADNIDDFNF